MRPCIRISAAPHIYVNGLLIFSVKLSHCITPRMRACSGNKYEPPALRFCTCTDSKYESHALRFCTRTDSKHEPPASRFCGFYCSFLLFITGHPDTFAPPLREFPSTADDLHTPFIPLMHGDHWARNPENSGILSLEWCAYTFVLQNGARTPGNSWALGRKIAVRLG